MKFTPFLFYIFLMPSLLVSQTEDEWKLVKQQKGIDVYVKTVPQSPVNAVKATMVVNCPIASAVAVILDVENHSKWMYQSKNAEVLQKISDTSWYYYAQTKAPWPAYDRDYVSRIVLHKVGNAMEVTGNGIPDYIPEKKDYVRLPYSYSQWKFTPHGNNKTFVELKLSVDVGGNLPPWIINLFISRGPYQTLLNFSIMVHDKKYRNANFSDFVAK